MATRSYGRSALALAVLCGGASPAHATRFDNGFVVAARDAVTLEPGDVVGMSSPHGIALRVGARATLDGDGIAVFNDGASGPMRRAYGVAVLDGGDVALSNSRVDVRAPSGIGVQAQHHAEITFERTHVEVAAEGTALTIDGSSRATLRDSALLAPRGGRAIDTRFPGGGVASVALMRSTVTGGVESGAPGLQLHASDSRLTGDMTRGEGGAFDVALIDSRWKGAAAATSSLSLRRSAWHVTSYSRVDAVTLLEGSQVVFGRTDTAFTTVRAGTWSTDGSASLVLSTRLDAGGPLHRQHTDRLLVEGDASGRTTLHIEQAGGAGGATSGRDGVNGPADGISVVQVGGHATSDAFVLAGGHVAVGPWRYELAGFAPGASDPAQRLLEGAGSFWDFRLQSVRLDQNGLRASATPSGDGLRTRPALAPQVPAYLVMGHAMLGSTQASADAAARAMDDMPRESSLRVQAFSDDVTYRSTLPFADFGIDYRRRDRGLSFSGDAVAYASGGARLYVGVAATVGSTNVAPRVADGPGNARIDARGVVLVTRLATDDGWWAFASYGGTHFRGAVETPSRGQTLGRLRANATQATLSASYRWQPGTHVVVAPAASVTWQQLRGGSATDRDGVRVGVTRTERLAGRAGARVALPFRPEGRVLYTWTPFVDVRYEAAHDSGAKVSVAGERFATGAAAGSWTYGTGAHVALWSRTSVSVDVSRRVRAGHAGESGLTAHAGLMMTL